MSTGIDYGVTLAMVGDAGVGKTCLVEQYIDHHFNGHYDMTVGIAYRSTLVLRGSCKDQRLVKVTAWDTSGQDVFHSMCRGYYAQANHVVVVFDVTQRCSFERVSYWYEQLRAATATATVTLVGNKVDMVTRRQVQRDEAERTAAKHGMAYVEASAKDHAAVKALFDDVLETCRPPRPTAYEVRRDKIISRKARWHGRVHAGVRCLRRLRCIHCKGRWLWRRRGGDDQ
jgi:small GTP-binding protein